MCIGSYTSHTANPPGEPGELARAPAKRFEENVARYSAGRELIATIAVEAGY